MRPPLARFVTSAGAALALLPVPLQEIKGEALIVACDSNLRPLCRPSKAVHDLGGAAVGESASDWLARYGPVPPGHAIWTGAGNLRSRGLIHAVIGESPFLDLPLIVRALHAGLALAAQTRCVRIAAPLLGAHLATAADLGPLALEQLRAAFDFLEGHPVETIEEVTFVAAEQAEFSMLLNEFLGLFGADSLVRPSLED